MRSRPVSLPIGILLLLAAAVSIVLAVTGRVMIGPCTDISGVLCLLAIVVGLPAGLVMTMMGTIKSRAGAPSGKL